MSSSVSRNRASTGLQGPRRTPERCLPAYPTARIEAPPCRASDRRAAKPLSGAAGLEGQLDAEREYAGETPVARASCSVVRDAAPGLASALQDRRGSCPSPAACESTSAVRPAARLASRAARTASVPRVARPSSPTGGITSPRKLVRGVQLKVSSVFQPHVVCSSGLTGR